MATGSNIRTWFEGAWHDADIPVMRAADHGTWLASSSSRMNEAIWFSSVVIPMMV